MTRAFLVFATLTLLPGIARAEPPYVRDFESDLGQCKPSCYQNEPAARWDESDVKRTCGYKEWTLEQTQLRNGSWTSVKYTGIPTAEPTTTACKLPGDGGALAKTARSLFESLKGDLTSLHFVQQGSWTVEQDDAGNPRRWVTMRVYAANWGMKPNECGGYGKVCEASGSKAALALNYTHFRLEEARTKKADKPSCLISSFAAAATARGLKKFHAHRVKKKEWTTGLTYKTRWDGDVDDKKLFELADKYEQEAVDLHKECGGASPLLTDVPEGQSGPEFYLVPNPAFD